MVEFFEIETVECWMSKKVKIWNEGEEFFYSIKDLDNFESETEKSNITMDKDLFDTEIHKIGIERWKKNYEPAGIVLDGMTWSVKYKADGNRTVRCCGNNACPSSWNKLLKLIAKAAGGYDNLDRV